MSENERGEGEWELAVPFIACASMGGPYEDEAFAAGFDLGQLFHEMTTATVPIQRQLRGPSFKQLDLLAMHRGWMLVMLTGPGVDPDDEEWLPIELTRATPAPPSPREPKGSDGP